MTACSYRNGTKGNEGLMEYDSCCDSSRRATGSPDFAVDGRTSVDTVIAPSVWVASIGKDLGKGRTVRGRIFGMAQMVAGRQVQVCGAICSAVPDAR